MFQLQLPLIPLCRSKPSPNVPLRCHQVASDVMNFIYHWLPPERAPMELLDKSAELELLDWLVPFLVIY